MSNRTTTKSKGDRLGSARTTTAGGALTLDHIKEQEYSVGFDFDAIDQACDGERTPQGSDKTSDIGNTPPGPLADAGDLSFALREAFQWAAYGDGKVYSPQAAATRLLAMLWVLDADGFTNRCLADVAREHGVTRAWLDKIVRSINRRFGVYGAGQRNVMHLKEQAAFRSVSGNN